VNSMALACIKY